MIYDVFIDESGLFTETSDDPGDRILEHKRSKKFPSQLAGVVVPEGQLSREDAWDVFKLACDQANISVGEEFHSIDIKKRGRGVFDHLVQATCRSLDSGQIQPFRLVNRERVSFGNRKANYTNILGELLMRLCKEMTQGNDLPITLNVYQAGVKNSEFETGDQPFWEHADFKPTLQTIFQRASIAAGWAKESAKWNLGSFKFRSGKKDPRLWICDLLSNASHNDFKTIDASSTSALKAAFGQFDFSLSFDTTLQQVRDLCTRQAYGIALIQVLEGVLSPWVSGDTKALYTAEFDRVAKRMLALSPLARNPQLQTVLGWIRQISDDRDRLDEAKFACKWTDERLVIRQQAEMDAQDPTLGPWVRLNIAASSLTACNHAGDLVEGRRQYEVIDSLIPSIAGRWEYASDLMESIVVQSVHMNDCFEHEKVCEKLTLVAEYYDTLGGLFREAYPDVFPKAVRSEVCGKALGTMVQSEIFLLLAGDRTDDTVRQTSDRAIKQFAAADDRKRQYQYRSEIESIVGQWQAAREFLAKGIGCQESDHDSLGRFIASLPEEHRPFPLLHWTRIGGMSAVESDANEFDAFLSAWKSSGLDPFVQQFKSGYPSHGILRRLACVYAASNDYSKAIESLRTLRAIVKAEPVPLFQLIELAAITQAAGIVGRTDKAQMERLLSGGKNDVSVRDLVKKMVAGTTSSHFRLTEIASQFGNLLQGDPCADQLIAAARIVGY